MHIFNKLIFSKNIFMLQDLQSFVWENEKMVRNLNIPGHEDIVASLALSREGPIFIGFRTSSRNLAWPKWPLLRVNDHPNRQSDPKFGRSGSKNPKFIFHDEPPYFWIFSTQNHEKPGWRPLFLKEILKGVSFRDFWMIKAYIDWSKPKIVIKLKFFFKTLNQGFFDPLRPNFGSNRRFG